MHTRAIDLCFTEYGYSGWSNTGTSYSGALCSASMISLSYTRGGMLFSRTPPPPFGFAPGGWRAFTKKNTPPGATPEIFSHLKWYFTTNQRSFGAESWPVVGSTSASWHEHQIKSHRAVRKLSVVCWLIFKYIPLGPVSALHSTTPTRTDKKAQETRLTNPLSPHARH